MQEKRSTRRWAGAAVVALAALTGALLVPQAASAATPLSGQVTYNGAGVAGVVPTFFRYDAEDGDWDSTGQSADSPTDASGNWAYTGTLSTDGIYSVFYYTDGTPAVYASNQGRGGVRDNDKLSQEFTVTGGVASVATIAPVALAINSGALQVTLKDALTGTVIGLPGSTSGTVQAYSGLDANGDYVQGNSASESTGFDGVILVPGLEPGTYYSVYATANTYDSDSVPTNIAVTAGQTTSLDIALYPSGTTSTNTLLPNPKVVSVTGVPKVGTLLTANVPVSAATVQYQWYSDDGYIIPGATSQTFIPGTKQLGHTLYVSARLSVPGYEPTTLNSEQTKSVLIGDPNQATVKVSGTAKFGHTLTAKVSGSTISDAKYSYRWYRNGTPLTGQVGAKYTLAKADVGQKVFASVTSFAQGHSDAVIPSNTVTIAKDKATITHKSKTSISKSTKLKVKVGIKDGASKNAATGIVKVFYTSSKYKKVTFGSKTSSKTVTLPKLGKGKHTLRIAYSGDIHYPGTSTTFKVTVK